MAPTKPAETKGRNFARSRGAAPLADLAGGIIDPLLARRAGITTALLGSWDEIAGERFADCTRPERIVWPRRGEGDDGGHRPGMLVVACEGARALFLSHAQGELIARINGFFGYPAVGQIRIVQKPVTPPRALRRRPPKLDAVAEKRLADMTAGIESEALRSAVARLGRGVLAGAKNTRR